MVILTIDTTVATVVATDADGTSPNNQFIYRIESGALDKFRLDFETGRVFVAPGVRLDREDQATYVMNVSAIDKGTPPLTGRCVVIVDVTDVNDEMPVFVVSALASADGVNRTKATAISKCTTTIFWTLSWRSVVQNDTKSFFHKIRFKQWRCVGILEKNQGSLLTVKFCA